MKNILLFMLVIFVTNCQSEPDELQEFQESKLEDRNIKLSKNSDIKIVNSEDGNLARPYAALAVSHDSKRFGLYDLIYNHFIIFNREGEIIQILGDEGRGPDEFQQALDFNFDEEKNLIAYDERQFQLKIFDKEGELQKNTSVFEDGNYSHNTSGLFANDSLIYIGITDVSTHNTDQAWQSELMGIFDYSGEKVKFIGQYDPYIFDNNFYGDLPLFDIVFEEDKIYSTHKNSYRIQVFNVDNNKKLDYFGRKSSSYKEADQNIETHFPMEKIEELSLTQSFPNGLFVTDNYILHYFQNATEEWFETKDPLTKEHYLSIYNRDNHAFVKELKSDYQLLEVQDNKLYLLEDTNPDNYTIGIYELESAS